MPTFGILLYTPKSLPNVSSLPVSYCYFYYCQCTFSKKNFSVKVKSYLLYTSQTGSLLNSTYCVWVKLGVLHCLNF